MEHKLFMIAQEGGQLVVTVACRAQGEQGPFKECIYRVGFPTDTGKGLSPEELFGMARKEFGSVKAAL